MSHRKKPNELLLFFRARNNLYSETQKGDCMHDLNLLFEIIVGWTIIVLILIRMVDEGLFEELQNLIEDLKKRRKV